MSLKIDDLPAPLRPMMAHRSPSATVKVTFLKSSVAPNETPIFESERRVTQEWGDKTEDALPRDAMRRRKAKCLHPHETDAWPMIAAGYSRLTEQPCTFLSITWFTRRPISTEG